MFLNKCFNFKSVATLLQKVPRQNVSNIRPITTQFPVFQQPKQEPSFEISDKKIQNYLENIRLEYYALKVSDSIDKNGHKRLVLLSHIVEMYEQRRIIMENIEALNDIKHEKDEDMLQLMKEEREAYNNILVKLDKEIMHGILSMDEDENYNSLVLEVTAGVGGQEAMLFAGELFDMYSNYIDYKGWDTDMLQIEKSDIGGVRHASIIVSGFDAYKLLKFEAGVHRVQRIPSTEKAGRVHTSTCTVAVIPKPDDFELNLKDKDLKIETKRASGAGGQHVNTTDSAVRIVHLPTGIAVECQTDRSQIKNREIAMQKLAAKIMQQELESQYNASDALRKSQVGSSFRNEKIRTYNFNQDRITDHRIDGGTTHNLKGFFEGSVQLNDMILKVSTANRKKHLLEIINNTIEKE